MICIFYRVCSGTGPWGIGLPSAGGFVNKSAPPPLQFGARDRGYFFPGKQRGADENGRWRPKSEVRRKTD